MITTCDACGEGVKVAESESDTASVIFCENCSD